MEGRDLIIEYMFRGKAKEFFAEKILEANVLTFPGFDEWIERGRRLGLSITDSGAQAIRKKETKRLVYSILDKDKIKDYPQASSYYIIARTICYPPPTYTYEDGIKLLGDANINTRPGSVHDYIMSAVDGLKHYFYEVRYWLNLLILNAGEG